MQSLDLDRLNETVLAHRERFVTATPFPHVVLDDLLYPDVADAVVREFDPAPDGWKYYQHFNEKKIALNDMSRMGPASRAVIADLQSDAFVDALGRLSGIDGLVADPELDGGGLQQTMPGGFLNVHTDFLAHTKRTTWSRQVNLLLFLNRDWEESHRGWLELWDPSVTRCVRRIEPPFNRSHQRPVLPRRPGGRRMPRGALEEVDRALLLPRRGADLSPPPDPLRPPAWRLGAPPRAHPGRPVAAGGLFVPQALHPAERRHGQQDPETPLSAVSGGCPSGPFGCPRRPVVPRTPGMRCDAGVTHASS